MKPTPPAPPAIRILGLATITIFLLLVARFWHPVFGFTAFFQLDATNDDVKLTAFRELPVYVYRDNGGYDGLYYAQLALDPTLRNPELARAMDSYPYRARRILPPALAWVAGLGRAAWIIRAYSLLNVVAWLAVAALLWRLLRVRDLRGWLAWVGVLFSAGALSSVRLALTDLTALAILGGAIFAAECWRGRSAVAVLALSGLARETSLVGVAGLWKPPWFSVKNVLRVLLSAAPLAAWLVYVRHHAGAADLGWGNFTWPVAGLFEKGRAVLVAAFSHEDPVLAWTTLLAFVALVVQAVYFATHVELGDRWWRLGAAYSLLMLWLGTAVWEGFPGAATRVLLPLTLAFNIHACRCRVSLGWLIGGNLAIFSGLLMLRDVPHDRTELAATRKGSVACIVHEGDGWYGLEHHGAHTWTWTAQRGALRLEAWPKSTPAKFELIFSLRAVSPRRVRVVCNGTALAEFEAGPNAQRHTVAVTTANGASIVQFISDAPAQPEPGGNRALGFALYDVQIAVARFVQ